MLLSIAVDACVRVLSDASRRKYDSQALEADALHFSTAIWSSAVVIVGLALVSIGRSYQVAWLRQADPVAALFVAGGGHFRELALGAKNRRCLTGCGTRWRAQSDLRPIKPSMACSRSSASLPQSGK